MPGSSGLCKNKGCVNPKTGAQRQAQSGCRGHCRTCARTFEAATAAEVRAKAYAAKGKCARCQVALAQVTDPASGARYCKVCAKSPGAAPGPTCAFCRSCTTAATSSVCTGTPGCGRPSIMCERCEGLHGARVCDRCWESVWRSACFACKAPLPTMRTWTARYCHGCFRDRFCGASDDARGVNDPRCFYCKTDAASVATRACTRTEGCPGRVNICDRCADLRSEVMCSCCWLLHWQKKCFACGAADPQNQKRSHDYGKFCKNCANTHSEAGRQSILRDKRARYEAGRDRDETPTGDEPALHSLLDSLPADPAAAPLTD